MSIIPPENVINSNYFDIDQLQTLKEFADKSSLSVASLNTCSLSKNVDDFEHLIQLTKTDFDIIAVSESSSMFVNSIYVSNYLQSCHQNVPFHQLRANKLKEDRTSACVYKFSIFTQNELALKLIQDFSLRFGPALRELSAAINRIVT